MDAPEHADVATLELLSKGQLHERHGQTDKEEADEVGDEEGRATPLEAEVGESPEVAEADTVADHGEDERHATQPTRSLFLGLRIVREAPNQAVFALAHGDESFTF